MTISIKKSLLMVILVLALLAALFSWTARMMPVHSAPYHSAQSSHTLAWYCPPPPRYC